VVVLLAVTMLTNTPTFHIIIMMSVPCRLVFSGTTVLYYSTGRTVQDDGTTT